MRKIAAVAALLALLLLGATLWGFAAARLELKAEAVRALPEEEFQLRFARLKEQLAAGAVRGTVYEETPLGDAEDYVILEYTIMVGNRGFIPARMLEAVVVPVRGDVLCFSQQEAQEQDVNSAITVENGRQMMLRTYLLTKKSLHAVREIQVSYYIWGNPFILKVRYG
ncbi:MAG: hypothetical protein GX611_08365 [Clostridiales bacterium]|nr:hypothetical protein [Clostridiales bacterium]